MPTFVRARNGELLVPDVDSGRFCLRCGIAIHVPDPAHLCKDILLRIRIEIDRQWQEWRAEMHEYGGEA